MDEAKALAMVFAGHAFRVGDMVSLKSAAAVRMPVAMQVRGLTVESNGQHFSRGYVVRHGGALIHYLDDELAAYPPPPTATDLMTRLDELLAARTAADPKDPTE